MQNRNNLFASENILSKKWIHLIMSLKARVEHAKTSNRENQSNKSSTSKESEDWEMRRLQMVHSVQFALTSRNVNQQCKTTSGNGLAHSLSLSGSSTTHFCSFLFSQFSTIRFYLYSRSRTELPSLFVRLM